MVKYSSVDDIAGFVDHWQDLEGNLTVSENWQCVGWSWLIYFSDGHGKQQKISKNSSKERSKQQLRQLV